MTTLSRAPGNATQVLGVALLTPVALLTLATSPAGATESDIDARCRKHCPATPEDSRLIEIDANTGAVLTTTTEFPGRDAVAIWFTGKNPFAYQYRYLIKQRLVETDVIHKGLQAVTGITVEGLETSKAEAEAQAKTAEAAAATRKTSSNDVMRVAVSRCPFDYAALEQARISALNVHKDALKDAQANSKDANAKVATLQTRSAKLFSGTNLPLNESECIELCTLSSEVRGQASAVAQLPSFNIQIDSLSQSKERLTKAIPSETGSEYCKTLVDAATSTIGAISNDITKLQQMEKELVAAKEASKTQLAVIEAVLGDDSAFVSKRSLGPVSEASEFDVSILRKARTEGAEETSIPVNSKIKIGRSRFNFSAGLGVSFVDSSEFGRAASVIDDTLVNVVSETSSSDARFGVVGQLNGFIWQPRKRDSWSVGWSLGAAVTGNDKGTNFGFYTGPSLAGLSDKWVFTLAYHLSETEELSGGFEVGDVIPADLTGDVPTKDKTEGALLLTVTVRVY